MTDPRPWPDNAKDARDGAAERVNQAAIIVDQVVGNGVNFHLPVEAVIKLYQAERYLLDALRLLESVGAQTRPPEL